MLEMVVLSKEYLTQKCTIYVSLSCLQGRLPHNGVMIFLPMVVLLQA